MADLGTQLTSAIALALSPTSSNEDRHSAYVFLQQVKQEHQATWTQCFALFLEKTADSTAYRWGGQERMFCLQVVGESLPALAPDAVLYVQSTLFDYFAREYASSSPGADSAVVYLKNATVHLTTLLFLHLYPLQSPSFLQSLLAFPLTPAYTDLLLRILNEISDEISDVHLRLNKSINRLNKDAELRDRVRERDAARIAAALWDVLGTNLGSSVGGDAEELAVAAMRVVGSYVSWIDINLVITPTTIPFLLQALHHPSRPILVATATTLVETVSKGMPSGDKLNLLSVLNLGNELKVLVESQEEDVRDVGGRLLNATGLELCKILEESGAPAATKSSSLALLTSLLPILLKALSSSPSSNALNALTPFATSLLAIYKKDKKRDPNSPIDGSKKEFLERLLEVVVGKMEYGEDVEWSIGIEGEEDEEQLLFAETRKNLTLIIDAIAWISPDLFSSTTRTLIVATLDAFQSRLPLPWQRVELALLLLYSFSQALSTTGPGAFVQVPPAELLKARKEADYRIDYTTFPLSALGECMVRACRSGVVRHEHPAVGLMFFETVVRYHDFFKLCPEYIAQVLPSFLDEHGLHQEDEAVRARVFYLFSRFIFQARGTFQSQVTGEFVSDILTRVQDLLPVTATMPEDDPATLEQLTKVSTQPSLFDSQLYLFEAAGTLISILNQIPTTQIALLRAVLNPLLSGLQGAVQVNPTTHAEFAEVLEAHHLIMAIGNVAKGFPDLSARTPVATGAWVDVFKEATESVLVVAKTMGSFVCIRNAARFFFNRVVATTGTAILPLIPMLIDCLLGEVTFPELSELLSFLGLLVAKYKTEFLPILDTLLIPVFTRVFYFLKLPITGTDDTIQHSDLRRAYFNFILSLTAANLQEVFYSEKNKPRLQEVLQSITHYIATDSLAPDQRFGFNVLNRFMSLWVTPFRPPTSPAVVNGESPSPVPGFEQFLYLNAVKLCFEVPLTPNFDYSDAQSYAVIGEISNLLKGLLQKRGPEFVEFMNGSLLPSIQCPPEAGERFMTALQEAPDGKQFKKFASEWLRTSRGAPR